MNAVQNFVMNNIYCAPTEDRQYSFKLVRVNKTKLGVTNRLQIYQVSKKLPDSTSKWHVSVLGNLNPEYLNMLRQGKDWFKDVWVRVSEDMVSRNYILKLYNENGVMCPREDIWYSFIDESSVVFAIKEDNRKRLGVEYGEFMYVNLYSNNWFNSSEFSSLGDRTAIGYVSDIVFDNTNKLALQNTVNNLLVKGGKAFVYINGVYSDKVSLNIPDNSFVEVVYDRSVKSYESYKLSDLTTFNSTLDTKVKFLVLRDLAPLTMDYDDDVEVYLRTNDRLVNIGYFYYRHTPDSVRNVTDKDFSLNANFVNNLNSFLIQKSGGVYGDTVIDIYVRRSGLARGLVYHSLDIHEFYKLPIDKQLLVLNSNSVSVPDYRAETFENSTYFKVMGMKDFRLLTPEVANNVLGYNGITHYFGNTPNRVDGSYISVPLLYQIKSTAYEYDASGKLLGYYPSVYHGPEYPITNVGLCASVEFVYGVPYGELETIKYLTNDDTFTTPQEEYSLYSAIFNSGSRASNWEDITDKYPAGSRNGSISYGISETSSVMVRVHNHTRIYVKDLELDISEGYMTFSLKEYVEVEGIGSIRNCDLPFSNLDIWLNGYRLTEGLDFHYSFPYISICSKKYINYTLTKQLVHVRGIGSETSEKSINANNVYGFVSGGVLTRNKYYDITDDKVLSVYIDGKLVDRNNILLAEGDNTVRVDNPSNGLPYSVRYGYIPLRDITDENGRRLYKENLERDKRISAIFNIINKEPEYNALNVISGNHYLFSPVISAIIKDVVSGDIPSSVYVNPYNDNDILQLVESKYKELLALDPVKMNLDDKIVVIHPHIGNSVIDLNLHQFRFVNNVIRFITLGNVDKVVTSGYISLSTA